MDSSCWVTSRRRFKMSQCGLAIFEWILWYNNERLHSSLDYM
ncbi:MAG: integrase core domain-containing protein [Acidimicrobiales bacterium]